MYNNIYKASFNRTKIVATIGPASSSKEVLKKIILAGADVCRINMSHGTHEQHDEVIRNIREINDEFHSNVCILLDLQGPKLRVGDMGEDGALMEVGNTVVVTSEDVKGNSNLIPVRFDSLSQDVKPGERVLLDDGKIHIEIKSIIDDKKVEAVVREGGILYSNKGFNLPETNVSFPALTEKDLEDLEFGMSHNVEWIGLSFVRSASDIIDLKKRIADAGKDIVVVAKIEKPEAIENIDSIIDATDGVMVARGDLGVEIPIEKVPLLQKEIVEKCLAKSKPVIIATQMMESMMKRSIPTRAEVTDVANAVLDGADAVMLSGETSVGDHPVLVVETMEKIINELEKDKKVYYKGVKPSPESPVFLSDEVCFTAVKMSDHLGAKVIAGMTRSGYSGYMISSFRPEAAIFIFTNNMVLLNRMNLVWGVRGFYYNNYKSTDDTFADIIEVLKQRGVVEKGDKVIHTASMPILDKSRANTIKISVVD